MASEPGAPRRRYPHPTSILCYSRLVHELHEDGTVSGSMPILADHLDKYVGDYSHGMKRKLQLVLATAHRPRLLVLDEPLRGLDPEAAILMNTVIERTAGAGNGVLIATHDLFAAERGCDEVVIVSEGRVVTQGAPAELLERHRAANLEALFLALTGIGTGLERKLQHLTHTLDPDRIDPVATEVSGGIS